MPECYVCGEEIPEEELDYTYAGTTDLKPIHKSCRPYAGKSSGARVERIETLYIKLVDEEKPISQTRKDALTGLILQQMAGQTVNKGMRYTVKTDSDYTVFEVVDVEPDYSKMITGTTFIRFTESSSSSRSSKHLSKENKPNRATESDFFSGVGERVEKSLKSLKKSLGMSNPGATESDFAAKGFGEQFAEAIYQAMYRTAQNEAIDWEENVADFIEKCEKRGGVVQFRTKYNDKRWTDPENPGKYIVLAICYGREIPEVPGQWFNNVPKEDIRQLEAD